MVEQQKPWSAPPPAPPPRDRVTRRVVGGVLLLFALVAAGSIISAVLYWPDTPQAVQGNPDEIVLRQEPGTGPARHYGDTAVYDACSLITIETLSRLGTSLSREHSVGHKHLDADVPPQAAITPGTSAPISSCLYRLATNDSLDVKVHQTPFNSAAELTALPARARATARSTAGLSSVSWQHDQKQHLVIWRDGLVIDISLETKHWNDNPAIGIFTTQLETVVRSGLSSAPTAPMRHFAIAPFERVADPCDIVSAEAYRTAFPSTPGPPSMVDASYPVHAPIATPNRGHRTARVANFSCTRNNIAPRDTQSLRAHLQVWTEQGPPDAINNTLCAPTHELTGLVPVTPPVGTRSSCLFELVRDWEFAFQVDRVNVTLSGGEVEQKPDVSVRRDQLVPAARVIASAGLFR